MNTILILLVQFTNKLAFFLKNNVSFNSLAKTEVFLVKTAIIFKIGRLVRKVSKSRDKKKVKSIDYGLAGLKTRKPIT
jgi:hypothetical protein